MITYLNVLDKNAKLSIFPMEPVNDICVQFNVNLDLSICSTIYANIGCCRINLLDVDKLTDSTCYSSWMNDLSYHSLCVLKEVAFKDKGVKTIAIIDFISIEESFRGKGYGDIFLSYICDYLVNLGIGIDIVGLISGFKDKDNSKLDKFYFSNGFEGYSNTNDNRKIMIKKLN